MSKKILNNGMKRLYEAPFVTCCSVVVEQGYLATSAPVQIENLGDTKEEGEW